MAHVRAMTEFARAGCYVFDYGNNLRGEAHDAGLADAFSYPGFVPAYIRPLFCRGIGPFRWAVLSGDPADIDAIDRDARVALSRRRAAPALARARARAASRSRGCRRGSAGSGYGDRARAGLAINELVRSGAVSAPVVIGRDHLDAGSVASPYRETEAMRDGSDAIADWPILNALVNVAAGATWVSVHHGGGVGIGNSIHAGMVVVADGTDAAAERLERVLTTDPGNGRDAARRRRLRRGARRGPRSTRSTCPSVPRRLVVSDGAGGAAPLLIRDLAQVASPAGGGAPLRGAALRDVDGDARRLRALRRRPDRGGRAHARPRRRSSDVEEIDGRGLSAIPGLVDCHTHACFAGDRVEEFSLRAGGRVVRGAPRARRRHPLDRPGDPRGRRGRARRRRSPSTSAGCAGGDDDVRGEVRATGSTTTRSSRSCARFGMRAASRRGSARTRCRPSSRTTAPTRTSTSCSAEVLPEAAQLAEAADVFLERGAFDADQARRYLAACRDAGLALRLHGDQFTESGAIPLAIELGARSVDHLEATGPAGVAALAASDVDRRPPPGERALPEPPDAARSRARRRGRAVALATDFNPGSAFCESLPLVCSLACTQMELAPEEALVGVHRERRARARPRRPDRTARAGLRRRHRPRSTRRGLAPRRVPPRRSRRPHRDRRRRIAWSSRA